MQPKEKERLLKYINDALLAGEELSAYDVLSVSFLPKQKSNGTTERGIEIINEALKRTIILKPDIELLITDVHKIFATRNKIAHEYDLVDTYQLFIIVKKNIPLLITELKSIIEQLELN